MTALEVIHDLQEKKRPAPNWTDTKGVYADLSGYPDVEYYVKCPKCGQVHGSYKTMREAHGKRLCGVCDLEAINKLKKEVKEVDAPKNRGKPGKSTSKLFNEADEMLPPPPPPEDDFDPREYLTTTPHGDWIQAALLELGDREGTQFSVAPRSRAFLDDPDSTTSIDLEGDDGTEWKLYKSEDEARTYALNDVEQRLLDEPENFTQDWLGNFVNQDRLKDYLREEAHDIEWLTDQSEQEQVDYLIKQGLLNEEDFYNEDMDFVDNEDLREAGLEAFREKKAADFDPMEWFRDVYGRDEAMKYAIEAVGIDHHAAAENAIDTDGWSHYVSSYDDSYTNLSNGAVAWRTN